MLIRDPLEVVSEEAPAENKNAIYWNALAAISDYYARMGDPRMPSRL